MFSFFCFCLFHFPVRLKCQICCKEHIDANQKVLSSACGMLAPITGEERHLTLCTGHCAAFVKAVNAGCRTPITCIQDVAGNTNLPFLKMQRQYQTMLEVVWEFIQRPWKVEAVWPSAPDVLQRALNSTSEVHSAVTELEGAVSIAECAEAGDDVDSAIAAETSGHPRLGRRTPTCLRIWQSATVVARMCPSCTSSILSQQNIAETSGLEKSTWALWCKGSNTQIQRCNCHVSWICF